MNQALSTARARIAGAMEALAVADLFHAEEDGLAIHSAQALLRRAFDDLGARFGEAATAWPLRRVLMDTVTLGNSPATSAADGGFRLELPGDSPAPRRRPSVS